MVKQRVTHGQVIVEFRRNLAAAMDFVERDTREVVVLHVVPGRVGCGAVIPSTPLPFRARTRPSTPLPFRPLPLVIL